MKWVFQFLRATLVGGLLFLVPITVLVLLLDKAFALAHKVVGPLAAALPVESVLGLQTPKLLAIGLIVVGCFGAGLLARTARIKAWVEVLETSVLSLFPGYEFLKGTGESLLGVTSKGSFAAVLVRLDDSQQLGFCVEVLDSGLVAVFIPDAPNPRSGAVHILTADRVQALNLPMTSVLKCLKRFGAGSNELLRTLSTGGASATK